MPVAKNLNKTITSKDKSRDKGITSNNVISIMEPGKDLSKPDSYRPVMLLCTYRKLLFHNILHRMHDKTDNTFLQSQIAFRRRHSTDMVLAHKFLIAAAKEKNVSRLCIGKDLSKAFDAVSREGLNSMLKRNVDEENIKLIGMILKHSQQQNEAKSERQLLPKISESL